MNLRPHCPDCLLELDFGDDETYAACEGCGIHFVMEDGLEWLPVERVLLSIPDGPRLRPSGLAARVAYGGCVAA